MENLKNILNISKQINHSIIEQGFQKQINNNKIKKIEVEFKNNLFDLIIKDEKIIKLTRQLFINGHHAQAVVKAYVLLNNLVKKISGEKAKKLDGTFRDGSDLMNFIFSPNDPIIKFNDLSNDSEKDEQKGFMQILSGCMTGIRNPRVHQEDWEDTETNALYMIAFADFLINKIKNSIKENV